MQRRPNCGVLSLGEQPTLEASMADLETVYGEPDLETFAVRAPGAVSSEGDTVTIAFKTYGPSIAITMSKDRAHQLASELSAAADELDGPLDISALVDGLS